MQDAGARAESTQTAAAGDKLLSCRWEDESLGSSPSAKQGAPLDVLQVDTLRAALQDVWQVQECCLIIQALAARLRAPAALAGICAQCILQHM